MVGRLRVRALSHCEQLGCDVDFRAHTLTGVNGEIVREGTTAGVVEGGRETIYLYRADEGDPKVIKGQ
jgi:hypothetical protein